MSDDGDDDDDDISSNESSKSFRQSPDNDNRLSKRSISPIEAPSANLIDKSGDDQGEEEVPSMI